MSVNRPPFRSAGTLMVQGTASDAGKSILVTALCRMLARHGVTVAPFKPQNMALNSAVTADGGEIGRSQAVQAQACYLQPVTAMNPILLKPNSDLGAQVIVNGKAIGNMQAQHYHQHKPQLLQTVIEAHRQLQQQYRVVIVEGAGSPAEINLREQDIANMGFAEAIDCPVIIVADIDRGGVFAHLYGTWMLLQASEQQRVQGFVINRFRGDQSLLEPGLAWLERKTGVPTLAVIPWIPHLHIEAEDSLAASQNRLGTGYCSSDQCSDRPIARVVVILCPRASNHTDFDTLRMHPAIDCQFQKNRADYRGADIIILPGSKNVRGDLQWLQRSGWAAMIKRHLRLGGRVIGICGGLQMLGRWVHDPEAVESPAGSTQGLGLLELETTLTHRKILRNVQGHWSGNPAIPVSGYEIHAGISRGPALDAPLLQLQCTNANSDDTPPARFTDGAVNNENTVMGTYLHGFFDEPAMLEHCLQWAGLDTGNHFGGHFDYRQYRDAEIDRLADAVEERLSLASMLRLTGLDSWCL